MTSRPLQLQWVDGRPRVLRFGCPLGQPTAPAPAPAPTVDLEAARAALESGAAGAAWRRVLEAGPHDAAEAEHLEAEAAREAARQTWRRACLHG